GVPGRRRQAVAVHPRQALLRRGQPHPAGRAAAPPGIPAWLAGPGGGRAAMTFTETPFLILALAAYAVWLATRRGRGLALPALLLASLVFYGHNHWRLLPLLLCTCLANWWVGRALAGSARPRLLLGLGVAFNLGLLAWFKYTPLVAGTLDGL